LCWADAVHPDVFGHGFSANNEVATIQNIDPREGKVMREFVGKAAFVTGGASGIGLALSRAFAEAGCKVMLADIEKAALDAAVGSLSGSGREIRGIVCDVADPASVDAAAQATFSAFGKVHILCNNAGVGARGGIDHIALDNWRWVIDVNLMGVVNGMRAFLPHMRARRVLAAVRDDELYIFTHPEMRSAVEERFQAILAAFDRAAAPPV
jgi:NAD(P)-dependent dehydrogenase (short-subunit alcohol dehydrogenase family)